MLNPGTFSTANLGSALLNSSASFTGFSEDLPSVGFTGDAFLNYVRKHNPWVDFTNVPAASNQPFTSFPANFLLLPSVAIVIPNQQRRHARWIDRPGRCLAPGKHGHLHHVGADEQQPFHIDV